MINFYDYFMCSRGECIYSLIFRRHILYFSTGSVLLCHANILFLYYLLAWSVSYREMCVWYHPQARGLLAVVRSSPESCLLRASVLVLLLLGMLSPVYAPAFSFISFMLSYKEALPSSRSKPHPLAPSLPVPLPSFIYFFPSEHLSRADTLNTRFSLSFSSRMGSS